MKPQRHLEYIYDTYFNEVMQNYYLFSISFIPLKNKMQCGMNEHMLKMQLLGYKKFS